MANTPVGLIFNFTVALNNQDTDYLFFSGANNRNLETWSLVAYTSLLVVSVNDISATLAIPEEVILECAGFEQTSYYKTDIFLE